MVPPGGRAVRVGASPEGQVRRGPGEVGLGRKRWGWMAFRAPESVPAVLCGPGRATSFSEPQCYFSVQ